MYKGRFTLCNLYHTILLYNYPENIEIIYESLNLNGVVCNYLLHVDEPFKARTKQKLHDRRQTSI